MDDKNFPVLCPHCNSWILIEQINCAIFRHGVDKNTLIQIPPHLDKNTCDKLFESGKLFGCGKPFRLILNPKYDPTKKVVGLTEEKVHKYIGEICEYI